MLSETVLNQGKATDREPAPARLTPVEAEIITLFVQLCHALGQPHSVGEIYGLLFISARPLALDDLMEHLDMSKGSASMGLKFLRNAGAVKITYMPGDRRLHYEAVAELRHLTARFVRDQILPYLDSGLSRLEHINGMVKQLPPQEREHVSARVTMLQSWEKKGRKFLPMVVKMMGG